LPEPTPDDPEERGQDQSHGPRAGQPDARGSGHARPVRTLRMSRGRRVGDAIISVFIRAGIVPSSYLLTTRGRRTGLRRTNPVTIVEGEGKRWLVAPYGPVSWVHNARASGRVTLRRGRETVDYTIREVTPEEAGPVLKQYVSISRPTRRYFHASKDAPVDEFVAEADRHPVFELIPIQ
jgi:deazaflavin-dependent oxidoreductase (nitroreductase family)